jgi:hypothetical protein
MFLGWVSAVGQGETKKDAYTSDTICFLSLSLILSKFNSFRAKIYVTVSDNDEVENEVALTSPSAFRRTFRIMPKEPLPITSSESYWSRKDDIRWWV